MELLTILVVPQSGDHVFAGYDELHILGRTKITIAVSYQLELKITKDGDTYWYVMVSSSSVVSNISSEMDWKFFLFRWFSHSFFFSACPKRWAFRLWTLTSFGSSVREEFQQYDFIMKDLVLSVKERDSFCHVTCLEHVRISSDVMDTSSVISYSEIIGILSTIILWRNDKYDLLMIRRRDQTQSYWRRKNAFAIDDVSIHCDGFVKRLKSFDVDVLNYSNECIPWT